MSELLSDNEFKQILRKDVPEEETWDLTGIYISDEKWEDELIQTDKELDSWVINPPKLINAQQLYEAIDSYDKLLVKLNRVTNYAMYKYSEDSTNTHNQYMMGRSRDLSVKANLVKTNFVDDLLQISKEAMAQFYDEKSELELFRRFLSRIDHIRDYYLSTDVEKALANLNSTLSAPEAIYLAVNASDITYEPVKDKNGKLFPVSLHMYMTQVETSPDNTLRRNAFKSLTDGLKKYQHGIAQVFSTEINKNVSLAKMRGFPSALDMLLQYTSPANEQFHVSDNLSVQFFEDILDTFRNELSPHMQRYARLRKQHLGLDKLLFSDIKAPLDPDFDPPISYEEAGEILVESVAVLGNEYQELMRRVFEERWVYRANNVGRRMIAFGGGVHSVHGYSFYPYGGNLFDVFLLGHELGHTLHNTLAADNQRIVNNSKPILFTEAPSTMVEHLVVDYLRKNRNDSRLHRWLNMYLMMSYHHNCVTHILEAELLRRLYKLAENNTPLTTAIYSETKGDILSEFWGDTVEIDEGAKLTWMRQPHYYMGLYPFTYSVGISASTVVAEQIINGDSKAAEKWIAAQKAGGSVNGFELYKIAGVDMSTTDNLKKTIAKIGTIVDELEESF